MPIVLNQPLRWKNANGDEKAMLQDLQANILKGHGRKHTANLFLRFGSAAAGRSLLQALAPQVTSAKQQLEANELFKSTKQSGGLVTLVFLTRAAYDVLGVAPAAIPPDAAFGAGMASRRTKLGDPVSTSWDKHLRGPIHAMLLLANDTAAQVKHARNALVATLPTGVLLLGEETGLGMASKRSPGEGIEHFGYVDGRSQPLLLVEDVEHERDDRDGISVWDPAFGLETALVADPAGKTANSFGSYLVFRKLEQNVRGFKKAEEKLAKALGLKGDDAERAGAMIIGRFEDGTPVVTQSADGVNAPVPNNFDFRDDPTGAKCPFHGHIRKTNPRGESTALGATLQQERAHLMARRGITYGKRSKHPNSRNLSFADMPTKDVGLLFMAYQGDIDNQFEFTQAAWVNNPNFVKPGTGIDPVIGQGPAGGQSCPTKWGGAAATPRKAFDFRGFVTMKGGEYFFAPSISGLKSL
jgi:Dyp-type peroxidase family